MIIKWLRRQPEKLKYEIIRHPRWLPVGSLLVLVFNLAVAMALKLIVDNCVQGYMTVARVSLLLFLAAGYLIWLLLFTMCHLALPRNQADLLLQATSEPRVAACLESSRHRARQDMGVLDVEAEVDEVIKVYEYETSGNFGRLIAAYVSHVGSLVLIFATFSYVIVGTAGSGCGLYGIKAHEPFSVHVYYSAVTLFTIGYGDIHPCDLLGRAGMIMQCVSILIVLIVGLNWSLSRESSRLAALQGILLAELRSELQCNHLRKA